MSKVREHAQHHAPIQGSDHLKLEAKLRALEKSGKLDVKVDQRTGKIKSVAPVVSSRAKKCVPTARPAGASAPSTLENVVASKSPVGSVLGGAALQNTTRSLTAATTLAAKHNHLLDDHKPELFHVGAVPDAVAAGGAAVAVVTSAGSVVSNAYKLHDAKKKKKANTKAAVDNAMEAFRFSSTGGKDGSGSALLKFNKASQPILATRKWRTFSSLDQQLFGSNIGRYFANTISGLSSFASYVAKAAGTVLAGVGQASGAAGIVGGTFEIASSVAAHEKADWDLTTTKRRQAGLEEWKKEIDKTSATPLAEGLHRAESKEQARRAKLARRTKFNAKVGMLKGSVGIAAGVALIVVSSIVTVATAGLWLAVAAGVVTAGLALYGLNHVWRESRVARHAKRRQRQSQALMATYSTEQLEKLMAETDPEKRKCKVATVERKHMLSRKKVLRIRTVDIGQNGYLATEIRARRLAEHLGKLQWNDHTRQTISDILKTPPDDAAVKKLGQESVNALRLLKYVGMNDMEILALCQIAITEVDPIKRSVALRPHMAAAQGLPWTAEKALPTAAYLAPLTALVKAQRDTGIAAPDVSKLAKDFRDRIGADNFKAFMDAMTKEGHIGKPYGAVSFDDNIVRIGRAIANMPIKKPASPSATAAAPNKSALVKTAPIKSAPSIATIADVMAQAVPADDPTSGSAVSTPSGLTHSTSDSSVSDLVSLDSVTSNPDLASILSNKGTAFSEVELDALFPDLPPIAQEHASEPKASKASLTRPASPRATQAKTQTQTRTQTIPTPTSRSEFSASQLVSLDSVSSSPRLDPVDKVVDTIPLKMKPVSSSADTRLNTKDIVASGTPRKGSTSTKVPRSPRSSVASPR